MPIRTSTRVRLAGLLAVGLGIFVVYAQSNLDEVVEFLEARPPNLHVVVTGRNAKEPLIEAADLVTEMTMVKHPFRAGVKAQKGIEF